MQVKLPNTFKSQAVTFHSTDPRESRQRVTTEHYDKWHCIREVLYEEYLWDMRTWHKPKFEYSREEIKQHIQQWILDHQNSEWTNNCGHCLYCIHRLLYKRWATWDEVINLIQKNNRIKYPQDIGIWRDIIED